MSNDKWSPSTSGVRNPTDSKKKNGMFWNWPRYLKFGGRAGAPMQDGTAMLNMDARKGNNAQGPISDRGKGK
jgi:hypothetical protein